jgi:hypothetical protein
MSTDHQTSESGASENPLEAGMIVTGLIVIVMLSIVVWTVTRV